MTVLALLKLQLHRCVELLILVSSSLRVSSSAHSCHAAAAQFPSFLCHQSESIYTTTFHQSESIYTTMFHQSSPYTPCSTNPSPYRPPRSTNPSPYTPPRTINSPSPYTIL